MDKYDTLLDLIEYPEKYTSDEVQELFSDPEIKGIYNVLCKTVSSLKSEDRISDELIESEWKRLHSRSGLRFPISSRAASVAIVIFSSLIALAVGIAVSVSVVNKDSMPVVTDASSGSAEKIANTVDSATSSKRDVDEESSSVIFEDSTLEEILKTIADHYNVSVEIRNTDAAGIHMFYKFDPSKQLEDIVEQLNTFDRISISIDGDTIIVD